MSARFQSERRSLSNLSVLLIAVAVCRPAWAQSAVPNVLLLRDYRFIAPKSTVNLTGGIAGVDKSLHVVGRFDLVNGFKNPSGGPTPLATGLVSTGKLINVHGILVDLRSATPVATGQDLDKTLNLSGLDGEGPTLSELDFTGVDGQGQPIKLEATIAGPLLHLTGSNDPGCCDFFNYKVDAWAHQLPWSDFNGDGRVDASDYAMWRQNFGSTVIPGSDGDANGDGLVDAVDYTLWRDQLGETDGMSSLASGQVPEPGTLALSVIGSVCGALVTISARRRSLHVPLLLRKRLPR
jgi:Dockerin type I domain/PEP-CTERM motif